jgi:1A family penicillin-binding protein
MKKFLFSIFKIGLILFFLLLIFILFLSIIQNIYLPAPNVLGEKIIGSGIEIYDRKGEILLYKIGVKKSWVNYEDIPQQIIKATLAAEDLEFFQHRGISLKGILRSIYLNLKMKRLEYGGSTITQQLVRNIFLSQEKTLIRKINEIILALKIEKKYSKEQIMTYYLNSIYYGQGNIGIKAAANHYFNKKLRDLSLAEIATLVAIPKSPSLYAPISKDNLIRLKKRRDYILERMKNVGWLNEQEYKTAINEEIKIISSKYTGIIAPHFVIEVIDQLKKMFPNKNLEELEIKVITTLDYQLQKIAEKAVRDGVDNNKKKYGGSNAALMSINPKTGEVLSLVGSRDFFDKEIDGQVNVPFRLRQPGSAFKPISYAALFELGYPEKTIIFDVPTNFGKYAPKNFDKKFKGPITLKQALAESRNIPAVKVFYLAFPEKVIELAQKSGMTYLNDWRKYGLSMALGTAEVKMSDLIRFYGALANDGKLVSQTLILKIIQDKKIVYEYGPQEERIISSQTSRILNDILSDVNARKGLFSASLHLTIFPGHKVALKTGTTQFYQDAWSFGYTPNIVVGVWAGNTDGKRMNSLGASLVAALPIFHQFLSEVIEKNLIPNEDFIEPEQRLVEKPMLNSQWLSEKGVHTILYYVQRDNPLGPPPENPFSDPQFSYWENGVQAWFKIYGQNLIENKDI